MGHVIGHVMNNDESSYQKEMNNLAECRTENNLLFSFSKTRELIVDFRKKRRQRNTPLSTSMVQVKL